MRGSPIRRPAFVPDWDRFTWDAAIHESGHALVAMVAGIGIREVFVPRMIDYGTANLPAISMAPGYGWAPESSALANAAGNGAEWSRGGRSRSVSPTDAQGFVDALGLPDRYHEFVVAAAELLRSDALAPKLEAIATYVYQRQGERIDTTVLWGVVEIVDSDRDLLDAMLVRLGSPAGRYASQEDREAREKWNAEMRAIVAKKRATK